MSSVSSRGSRKVLKKRVRLEEEEEGTGGSTMSASSSRTESKIELEERRDNDRWVHVHKGNCEYEEGMEVEYGKNNVITSKYTLLSFPFKNLLEQFSNVANLYFLAIGILQIIPSISTTNGVPSMYQALAFIVFVSGLRAAMEDYGKHKEDAARNNKIHKVLRPEGWRDTRSGQIKVGDIVRVLKDEMIPADMIFLSSSLLKGHCFIDKANLNGETTLEVLNSFIPTRKYFADDDLNLIQDFNADLVYEQPNARFDSFRGQMKVYDGQGNHRFYSIDGKSLLMRETNLRNCDFLIGMVVYSGDHTKIQVSNSLGEKTKTKVSRIMKTVETYLKYMFLAQFFMCLLGGIMSGYWYYTHTDHWYLDLSPEGDAAWLYGFESFFTWYILLCQMVPISLIVSGEMVKFSMSVFIDWDIRLYYPPIDKPAKCNSSTIHEDLGLVDYIFSDKTGTLTQNKMQFRYCLINTGRTYGSMETDIAKSVKARNRELEMKRKSDYVPDTTLWTSLAGPLWPEQERHVDCCERNCTNTFNKCWGKPQPPPIVAEDGDAVVNEFTDAERQILLHALWGPLRTDMNTEAALEERMKLRRYITHLALSNTVKPYVEEDGELKFQAESAEELAMVQFARSVGFLKKTQNPTRLEIKAYKEDLTSFVIEEEVYNHVATMGFTSQRARVSVVLQCVQGADEGKVHVMLKGQDSVVLPLLQDGDKNPELMLSLKDCYSNGLRTLVAGYAVLPEAWWAERAEEYHQVITMDGSDHSQGHPSKCSKAPLCEKCVAHQFFEVLEKDCEFEYLGCMGMEDQLQLLVPQTIADCLRAGIKVWMITGDKLETAKNIGLACNLIDPDMVPNFDSDSSIEEVSTAFDNGRLIEITGHWAHIAQDEAELCNLFRIFDTDGSGRISMQELSHCLTMMNCPINQTELIYMYNDLATKDDATGEEGIGREEFVELMRGARISMYDAVLFDIQEGFARWKRIKDHDTFPISLLINRDAFQTMFPPKKKRKKSRSVSFGRGSARSRARKSIMATLPEMTEKEEQKLEVLRSNFFNLASIAKSVVFARAEPAMKKKMVTEIRARQPQAITLAIGDGANDTDMITAAHVGVGIAGVEGTAATNSADYAIGTFRMLHTLLFVHGFNNYNRMADMVNFIFYKAGLVALVSYCFALFSGFSAQQFINDPIYQLYNVCYTALPILAVSILNKPLPSNVLENNAVAYAEQKGVLFTPSVFAGWMFRTVAHSCWMFAIPYNTAAGGMWFMSTIVYFCVGILPSLMVVYLMLSFTTLHFLSIFPCSIGSIFLFNFLLSHWIGYNPDLYGVVDAMYADVTVWLILLLTISVPLLIEMAWRGLRRDLRPTFTEILRERYRLEHVKEKELRKEVSTRGGHSTSTANLGYAGKRVVLDSKDEERWRKAKPSRAGTASKADVKFTVDETTKKAAERNRFINSMLRFKKMTGANYDSAEHTEKLQRHDSFVARGQEAPEKKEAQEGFSLRTADIVLE